MSEHIVTFMIFAGACIVISLAMRYVVKTDTYKDYDE